MYKVSLEIAGLMLSGLLLVACGQKNTNIETSIPTSASAPNQHMHPSWDADKNGVNDCETNGSCDHTIDYTQPRPAAIATPAFDCTETADDSIQHLICQEPTLAQLDNQLADITHKAKQHSPNNHLSLLASEQPEWRSQLEACENDEDQIACLKWHYQHRIAELQVRSELVPSNGPFHFTCGEAADTRLEVTFYQSSPPTMLAIRGDEQSLLYIAPSASGSRYESDNESFWEHQGEARLIWGANTQELRCIKTD